MAISGAGIFHKSNNSWASFRFVDHHVGAEPGHRVDCVPAGADESAADAKSLCAQQVSWCIADDPALLRCVVPAGVGQQAERVTGNLDPVGAAVAETTQGGVDRRNQVQRQPVSSVQRSRCCR